MKFKNRSPALRMDYHRTQDKRVREPDRRICGDPESRMPQQLHSSHGDGAAPGGRGTR